MSIQHVGRGGEEENTQTQNSLSSPLARDVIFYPNHATTIVAAHLSRASSIRHACQEKQEMKNEKNCMLYYRASFLLIQRGFHHALRPPGERPTPCALEEHHVRGHVHQEALKRVHQRTREEHLERTRNEKSKDEKKECIFHKAFHNV